MSAIMSIKSVGVFKVQALTIDLLVELESSSGIVVRTLYIFLIQICF